MKRIIRKTSVSLLLLVAANHARAMPVFDFAAFGQAVKQVEAWKEQFDQMAQQIKQLQEQNAAMTGSRGLGDILNDPQLRSTVPPDIAETLGSLRTTGASAMTPLAVSIRQASKIYDCEGRVGADRITCQAFLNNSAQAEAIQQTTMVRLNQRMNQINGLQGQINSTTDPKSIAELTARLVAESAQVANDANRIVIMRAMSDSADRAHQQALKEKELLRLSRSGDGSDTFAYKPYVAR